MFVRAMVLILGLAGLAVALLSMRHDRFELNNQMTRTYAEMERTRHETLNLQEQQAAELEPNRLQQRLDEAGIEVAPAVRADDAVLGAPIDETENHDGQRG